MALAGYAAPKPSPQLPAATLAALPPDATTERDIARVLSSIDAHAAVRVGFTATYHVVAAGSEMTIRFTYLAPDRARLDVGDGGKSTTMCVGEDVAAFRTDVESFPRGARYRTKDLEAHWADCNAALDAAFPAATADATRPRIGPGPVLAFGIKPDAGSSEHGSLELSLGSSQTRSFFMTWLDAHAWDLVHFVDARRIEVSRGGTRATIDVESGLLQDLAFGENFRATLVESGDTAAPSEFALLSGTDASAETSDASPSPFDAALHQEQRENVYRRLLPAARAAEADADGFRRRAEPVFVALYRATFGRQYQPWLKQIETQDESFFQECESYYTATRMDAMRRELFDHRLDDWRASLAHELDATRDAGLANLEPMRADPGDAAASAFVWSVEREAARTAFDLEVAAPLLRHVDEKVKALREVK